MQNSPFSAANLFVFLAFVSLSFISFAVSYAVWGRKVMIFAFIFWLVVFYLLFFRRRAFDSKFHKLGGYLVQGKDSEGLTEALQAALAPLRLLPGLPTIVLRNQKNSLSFLVTRWGKTPTLFISLPLLEKLRREGNPKLIQGLLAFYHLVALREQTFFFQFFSTLAHGLFELADALDQFFLAPLALVRKFSVGALFGSSFSESSFRPISRLILPLCQAVWKLSLTGIRWGRIDFETHRLIGTTSYSKLLQICQFSSHAHEGRLDLFPFKVTIENPLQKESFSPRLALKKRFNSFNGVEPSF